MALYESVFIARQDIPSQEVETLADGFSTIVDENGGSIAYRENWGLRNMAYRIKKYRKGHYVMMHIDAPSAAVQEMERNMRLSEDVLRYMTIRVDAFPETPSVIMQTRSSRDDRGRRDGGRREGGRREERAEAAGDGPAAKLAAAETTETAEPVVAGTAVEATKGDSDG